MVQLTITQGQGWFLSMIAAAQNLGRRSRPGLFLLYVLHYRLILPLEALFMASGQSGDSRGAHSGTHWLTTVASLAVGAAFFALWCGVGGGMYNAMAGPLDHSGRPTRFISSW
jgi:hypothetical protein